MPKNMDDKRIYFLFEIFEGNRPNLESTLLFQRNMRIICAWVYTVYYTV